MLVTEPQTNADKRLAILRLPFSDYSYLVLSIPSLKKKKKKHALQSLQDYIHKHLQTQKSSLQ